MTGGRTDFARRVAQGWRLIALGVVFAVSAAAAAGLYCTQYRSDQQTSETSREAAVNAASEGTVALLSYAPESLDRDLATAKAHLTGEFLTYYSKFSDEIVAPAAKQNAVKTTASVARAAVAELRPEFAKVLIFLNQETMSRERPDPALTASSVLVSLTKSNGSWLISAFDPV
jgi:Mce-associated membrane protein